MAPKPNRAESNSYDIEEMLQRVTDRVNIGATTIGLEIELSSHEPLPTPLLELVSLEVGGQNAWSYEEADLEDLPLPHVLLPDALRLFHPPFGSWYAGRSARPLTIPTPVNTFPLGGLTLGRATILHAKANTSVEVRLPDEDRLRHLYVIGRTGAGKTNLLRGLVAQELQSPSTGIAVVDPHGDLAGHAINLLPRSRFADLAVLDFSDPDLTPVLNPLLIDRSSRLARSRLSQEILEILKARVFHEFGGPRFDAIIRLLLDTLLDEGYPVTPSLVDAGSLLTDEKRQRYVRNLLRDDELKGRWQFHDKLKSGKEYYDLLDWAMSKLDDIAQDDTLRSVLGGEQNTVDISSVVQNNGVLIVSIPESVIGRNTAEFIGSLVLQSFKNALFRRPIRGTVPFYLYVDEFQRFAGVGFEELLAESRKFGVGLIMAHQNIEQLRPFSARTGQSTNALLNSLLGNVNTIVSFPIGSQDAELLSAQLNVSPRDVARIARYEAVVKMTLDGQQLPAFTISTDYAEPGLNPRRLDEIREYTARHKLMLTRIDVARQIKRRREQLENPNLQHTDSPDLSTTAASRDSAASVSDTDRGSEGGSSFLDEWLRKRADVTSVTRGSGSLVGQPERTHAAPAPTPIESDRSLTSWAEILGPVVRLELASSSLGRSLNQLRADAKRGRLMILTTRQGTEIVPASHFQSGQLVPGLVGVLSVLTNAPFGPWTRAAWLATSSPSLGSLSPLEYLRAGGDPEMVMPLVEAYAEEF